MRDLCDALVWDYGLNLTGWCIRSATAVSADGLTIVGDAIGESGHMRAWIAELPICCEPGDMNCDGQIGLVDLATFLSHFGRCSVDPDYFPHADIDRRGCVDLPDLAVILAQFGTECD